MCYLLGTRTRDFSWTSSIPLASLLSGVGLLVVGTGLMFSAIGAQAGLANFSGFVTGLIMSAYFAGFIFGTYACPAIIRRVGHIRTFAAMASLASCMSAAPRPVAEPLVLGRPAVL